jgi:YesN/AraC family two-component response regulator
VGDGHCHKEEVAMYNLVIVDDESKIRNGLCNYFPWHEIGFRVTYDAKNGRDALNYIQNNHVDVILSDIKMPEMSGIELIEQLHRQRSKIKVVFLTGFREFELAQKALVFGAVNFILKPTKYHELVSIFSKIREDLDECRTDKREDANDISVDDQSYHSKIIALIKSYVDENYNRVTLDDVAELVHMNPTYVSKYFKQRTGQKFSDYVISVKMKKAADLLNDIRYRICDVSNMVGYENAKNFSTTFKKYYGKNPKEFREKS